MSWPKGKSRGKTEKGHHIYGKGQLISGLFTIIGFIVAIWGSYNNFILIAGIILITVGVIGAVDKIIDGLKHLMYGR